MHTDAWLMYFMQRSPLIPNSLTGQKTNCSQESLRKNKNIQPWSPREDQEMMLTGEQKIPEHICVLEKFHS